MSFIMLKVFCKPITDVIVYEGLLSIESRVADV